MKKRTLNIITKLLACLAIIAVIVCVVIVYDCLHEPKEQSKKDNTPVIAPVVVSASEIDNLSEEEKAAMDEQYKEFMNIEEYNGKEVSNITSEEDLYGFEYADSCGLNWIRGSYVGDYSTMPDIVDDMYLFVIQYNYPDWELGRVWSIITEDCEYLICENKNAEPYIVKNEG